jgi:hypothetical protein
MWICAQCGEAHEDQFTACWSCQALRDANARYVENPIPPAGVPSESAPLPLVEQPEPRPLLPIARIGVLLGACAGPVLLGWSLLREPPKLRDWSNALAMLPWLPFAIVLGGLVGLAVGTLVEMVVIGVAIMRGMFTTEEAIDPDEVASKLAARWANQDRGELPQPGSHSRDSASRKRARARRRRNTDRASFAAGVRTDPAIPVSKQLTRPNSHEVR